MKTKNDTKPAGTLRIAAMNAAYERMQLTSHLLGSRGTAVAVERHSTLLPDNRRRTCDVCGRVVARGLCDECGC
jgi:hypothetical protein